MIQIKLVGMSTYITVTNLICLTSATVHEFLHKTKYERSTAHHTCVHSFSQKWSYIKLVTLYEFMKTY
jgi:hypothetical protein